jgi:hypothetical protein
MLLKTVQYSVWVLSSVFLFATAVQLWRSGRVRNFRVFTFYLVFVGSCGLINLALSFIDPTWWFYSFFAGNVITTLLAFAVLFEVAKSAISIPIFKLDASRFLSFCAIAAVLAVVVSATTDVNGNAFIKARILLEVALRVMQVSILAIFAGVSIFFGLLWHRVEFGIVLGYGIYAASQLAVMYLQAAGGSTRELFVFIPLISFCCAALTWFVYSSLADPIVDVEIQLLLSNVQTSLQQLKGFDR